MTHLEIGAKSVSKSWAHWTFPIYAAVRDPKVQFASFLRTDAGESLFMPQQLRGAYQRHWVPLLDSKGRGLGHLRAMAAASLKVYVSYLHQGCGSMLGIMQANASRRVATATASVAGDLGLVSPARAQIYLPKVCQRLANMFHLAEATGRWPDALCHAKAVFLKLPE